MTPEVAEPQSSWAAPPAGDLPDVNVWLALAVSDHPHHSAARTYWDNAAAPRLWFCRVTMLALVRLMCQPRVMGEAALDLAQAFDVYRRFTALPEIGIGGEPEGCEATLEAMTSALEPPLPARLWTDAYLAAFAIGAGLRLVTFDRDFGRFANLDCLRLPATAG